MRKLGKNLTFLTLKSKKTLKGCGSLFPKGQAPFVSFYSVEKGDGPFYSFLFRGKRGPFLIILFY